MNWRASFSLAVICAVTGCHGAGGVRLTEVATAAGPPSNVASVVTVSYEGQPVVGLRPNAFELRENEQILDRQAIDLRLLDPARAVAFHTVLLLDLGHAWSDLGKRELKYAAAQFVHQLQPRQAVTVLGFDGSKRNRVIAELSKDPSAKGDGAFEHTTLAPSDPSRNLRGAVTAALDTLDARLNGQRQSVKAGTLVVFSRGPDAAGRVPEATFESRLSSTPHRIVFVAVAGDSTAGEVSRLSANVRIEAQGTAGLSKAFDEAAASVTTWNDSHYVLSYCSPGRDGVRRLTLGVSVVDDNLETHSDSFQTQFEAPHFAAGCDPTKLPAFRAVVGTRRAASSLLRDAAFP